MKKKLEKGIRDSLVPVVKEWCSYCQAKTMQKQKKAYLEMEVWECSRCKLLERYK